MVYFLSIFFILLVPTTIYIQRNFGWKENSSLLLFLFFAIFEIFLTPWTVYKTSDFNSYSIMVWIVFGLILFSYLSLLTTSIIKSQNRFAILKGIAFEYSGFILVALIYSIVIVFLQIKQSDVNAYINLSALFRNGSYSFDGVTNTDFSYQTSSMYFTYSVLGNNVAPLYYYLNSIIYFVMISSVLYQYVLIKCCGPKGLVIASIMQFFLAFIIVVWLAAIVAGNILFQSAILLYSMFYLIRYKNISCFIPLIALEFFSPTGALLSVPMALLFATYFFFTKNSKDVILSLAVTILSLTYGFLIGVATIAPSVSRASLQAILILFYAIFIIGVILYELMNHFNFGKDKNIMQHININNKWFIGSIFILFLFAVIMNIVTYDYIIKSTSYQKWMVWLYLGFFVIIGSVFFYLWYEKQKIFEELAFLIGASLYGAIFMLIMNVEPSSHGSTWRLMFLNFGMGSMADMAVIVLIITSTFFGTYYSAPIQYKWYTKITSEGHVQLTLSWIVSLLSTACLITSFIFYNAEYRSDVAPKVVFSNNANDNFQTLNHNEQLYLKNSLGEITHEDTFISDLPIMTYLGRGQDISNEIAQQSTRSYWVTTFGFLAASKSDNDPTYHNNIDNLQKRINNVCLGNADFIKPNYFVLDTTTSYYQEVFENVNTNSSFDTNYKMLPPKSSYGDIDIAIYEINS